MADDEHPNGLSPLSVDLGSAYGDVSPTRTRTLEESARLNPGTWLTPPDFVSSVPSLRRAFAEHVQPFGTPRGLQGDGWARTSERRIVLLESQVWTGSAAYVRTRSTQAHPQVGTFRGDSDGGTCQRVRGFRFDHVSLEGSTDGMRSRWSAVLSQVDGRKGWHRYADSGFISARRTASGRYDERAPTNRKRKRERCKARRRLRLRLRRILQ